MKTQHEHGGRPDVLLYSDGACSPNPGLGGWGVVLIAPGHEGARRELWGAEANTTNNRMELMGVIKGLEALKRPCHVTVTTDSEYIQKAFTQGWLEKWQRNGWRTAGRKPVKNEDLWRRLVKLIRRHKTVQWHWVRGHADNEENNRCDELAVQARSR